MDSKKIFRIILEQEQALRTALRTKPSEIREIESIRNKILEKSLLLVSADPLYASSKDLEQILWKPCFYKRIEDYRKKIRKYAAASSDAAARRYLHQVCSSFNSFLNEASVFYQKLLYYFRQYLKNEKQNLYLVKESCHQTLIFLGDLARYRELHSESKSKDWAIAEGFYHQALAVLPDRGNPHNQLAVLSTYIDAECVAAYRYCRSLMVTHPFVTAEENLVLLFEKNKHRKIPVQIQSTVSKNKSSALKHFLHQFVRLQGDIFTEIKQSRESKNLINSNSLVEEEKIKGKEINPVLFYKEFEDLLEMEAIGDVLLLKIIIICIFSCLNTDNEEELNLKTKKLAYEITWNLITKVIEMLDKQSSCTKTNESLLNLNPWRLLGTLSVFCEWIRVDQHAKLFSCCSLFQEQEEQPCQLTFWKALSSLLSQLYSFSLSCSTKFSLWKEKAMTLKESVELRGFLPLDNVSSLYTEKTTTFPTSICSDDDEALALRIMKLLDFGYAMAEKNENQVLEFVENQFTLIHPMFLEKQLNTEEEKAVKLLDDSDDEIIVFQPSFLNYPINNDSTLLMNRIDAFVQEKSTTQSLSYLLSQPPQHLIQENQQKTNVYEEKNSVINSVETTFYDQLTEERKDLIDNGKIVSKRQIDSNETKGIFSSESSFTDSTPFSDSRFGIFGGSFQGFNWGNNENSHSNLNSISNSTSNSICNSNSNSFLWNDSITELAALEKECERYGSAPSSLIPFKTISNRDLKNNRLSPPRPPPGFTDTGNGGISIPPGFSENLHGCSSREVTDDRQLYTTNPFIQ